MSFKRRAQFNKINHFLQGGADCVTFLPGRGGCPQDRWGDSLSCIVGQPIPNPCYDSVIRLGGGVKYAAGKHFGFFNTPHPNLPQVGEGVKVTNLTPQRLNALTSFEGGV